MSDNYHISVLLKEVLESLDIEQNKLYLDCTLGDGGYSLGIIDQGGKVIALDQDQDAIERTENRFFEKGISQDSFKIVRGNFKDLGQLIKTKVSGIVYDLGVSSYQLDNGQRGFSFRFDAPLDMRMDQRGEVRALDLINGLNKGELEKLFLIYGEVKNRKVIDAILKRRERGQIQTTTELAEIITKVAGMGKGIHPATLYFQAIRIAVNDEINSLKDSLPQALELLESQGRLVVVSFHSLEDRVVKEAFKEFETEGKGVASTELVTATEAEIRSNPRARSAKLRTFTKK